MKNYCDSCGRHNLKLFPLKDKPSDPDNKYICITCIAETIANLDDRIMDECSAEAYSNLQHWVSNKALPDNLRKTLFFKILASRRMKNMLKNDGIELQYNYGDNDVKITKKGSKNE
jgi:hypothetical protein